MDKMKFKLNQCLLVAVVFIFAVGCSFKSGQLRVASSDGETDKVQALLAQGADVNNTDNEGRTALMVAALRGHTEIVQSLLEQGGDVNAKDNNGRTALMTAENMGYVEIIRMLKKAGAK